MSKKVRDKKQKDNAAKPKKLSRKKFDEELYKLQVELCKLQEWVKKTGARAAVVFEGRDAAGKGGVKLIKYWFEVGMGEQERRFRGRIEDPRKHWKLSPMDLESHSRWYDYSKARDEMLELTDTGCAPWHVVRADNKRKARLNCITHLLSQFPYEEIPFDAPTMPKRKTKNKYDDQEPMQDKRWIEEVF